MVEMKCKYCKKCGAENANDNNFCEKCGEKLGSTCKCWVNQKDNYDCGESSCPGYGLWRISKHKMDVESAHDMQGEKGEEEDEERGKERNDH